MTIDQPDNGLPQAGVPAITIITVVYNEAAALANTIRSVQAQKAGPFPVEYIVIDGGSTDGAVDLLRRHDGDIAYWVSEKDQGIYDAMNKGWRRARPDSFILFLGAGDEILSLPQARALYTDADVIYGKVEMASGNFRPKVDLRLRLVNTLHHQAMLVRRSLHPQPPFDLRLRAYADFDFNQRLYKHGARFAAAEDFRARAMPGGLSRKHYLRESLFIVNKNFGPLWAGLAVGYYLGYYALRSGARSVSLQNTVRSLPASHSYTTGDW